MEAGSDCEGELEAFAEEAFKLNLKREGGGRVDWPEWCLKYGDEVEEKTRTDVNFFSGQSIRPAKKRYVVN